MSQYQILKLYFELYVYIYIYIHLYIYICIYTHTYLHIHIQHTGARQHRRRGTRHAELWPLGAEALELIVTPFLDNINTYISYTILYTNILYYILKDFERLVAPVRQPWLTEDAVRMSVEARSVQIRGLQSTVGVAIIVNK